MEHKKDFHHHAIEDDMLDNVSGGVSDPNSLLTEENIELGKKALEQGELPAFETLPPSIQMMLRSQGITSYDELPESVRQMLRSQGMIL